MKTAFDCPLRLRQFSPALDLPRVGQACLRLHQFSFAPLRENPCHRSSVAQTSPVPWHCPPSACDVRSPQRIVETEWNNAQAYDIARTASGGNRLSFSNLLARHNLPSNAVRTNPETRNPKRGCRVWDWGFRISARGRETKHRTVSVYLGHRFGEPGLFSAPKWLCGRFRRNVVESGLVCRGSLHAQESCKAPKRCCTR